MCATCSLPATITTIALLLNLIHIIISAPPKSPPFHVPDQTTFEDPVQNFLREHPNETLPPWSGLRDKLFPNSDALTKVQEDLATRIAELKEDGDRLRTSIEDSNGVTQTQISSLSRQVFQKIHDVQNQVSVFSKCFSNI